MRKSYVPETPISEIARPLARGRSHASTLDKNRQAPSSAPHLRVQLEGRVDSDNPVARGHCTKPSGLVEPGGGVTCPRGKTARQGGGQ
jgi:hypothetical protein